MKICCRCKIEKPKTEFSKDASRKDGLVPKCRSCFRDYYAAKADQVAVAGRAYRSIKSAMISDRKRKYQKENAEKISERKRKHYAENIDRIRATQRGYHKKNPEKCAAYSRNRKARKRNSEGSHTAADVRSIFESQRGLCANCKTKLFKSGKQKFHVDHVMPLVLGGSNWPTNLQCLCPTCNLSKGAKHPDEWAKENGRLI